MSVGKERRLYIASILLLTLLSSVFLLMPVANMVSFEMARLTNILLGTVFWVTGILGYSLLIWIYRVERGKKHRSRKFRVFIFSNIITAIADTVFAAGLIIFIILVKLRLTTNYIVYINIFIIALSFNMHWMFSRNIHTKLLIKERGGRNNG